MFSLLQPLCGAVALTGVPAGNDDNVLDSCSRAEEHLRKGVRLPVRGVMPASAHVGHILPIRDPEPELEHCVGDGATIASNLSFETSAASCEWLTGANHTLIPPFSGSVSAFPSRRSHVGRTNSMNENAHSECSGCCFKWSCNSGNSTSRADAKRSPARQGYRGVLRIKDHKRYDRFDLLDVPRGRPARRQLVSRYRRTR